MVGDDRPRATALARAGRSACAPLVINNLADEANLSSSKILLLTISRRRGQLSAARRLGACDSSWVPYGEENRIRCREEKPHSPDDLPLRCEGLRR
jgi:hypothetical protein